MKPENIFVTRRGHAKILDFGLAKIGGGATVSLGTTRGPDEIDLTRPGSALGTVAYMSPEQVRGEELDPRTDLFSLGAVLYEMATRRQAFGGRTQGLIFHAILSENPAPARNGNVGISPRFEEVLGKALEKNRELRYQSAAEMRADLMRLKRDVESATATPRATTVSPVISPGGETARARLSRKVVIAAGAALFVLALVGSAIAYRSISGRGQTIESVVVLPFVNESGDPNTEYLSDGISESLIYSLSQLPHLRVMSRDSAFTYKGKEVDARAVGHDLNVRAVFKGRVLQRGNELQISAELVDARDNSQIWGQQFVRQAADFSALQGELAKQITSTLKMRLTGEEEKRIGKSYTTNTDAYQDYLRGRYFWNKKNRDGLNKAKGFFESAIEKDPAYALAYTGLADTYSALVVYANALPKEAYPKAKDAARKALEIDDGLAEAHASLGFIQTDFDWDWQGAETELRKAIALNPNYAVAHYYEAILLKYTNRIDQALLEDKRALELDPLSPSISRNLGTSFYFSRQYDQAAEQYRKTLEIDPNFASAINLLGDTYTRQAKYHEAQAEYQKALALSPDSPTTLSKLVCLLSLEGRKEEAQQTLAKLMALSKSQYVSAMYMVRAFSGLGDRESAFRWLEKAYEERSSTMAYIRSDAIYDPLRTDPRFAALLRRMNLQP